GEGGRYLARAGAPDGAVADVVPARPVGEPIDDFERPPAGRVNDEAEAALDGVPDDDPPADVGRDRPDRPVGEPRPAGRPRAAAVSPPRWHGLDLPRANAGLTSESPSGGTPRQVRSYRNFSRIVSEA